MSLRGFCKILLAALLLFACTPAFAGKRVALVLGNSAYQNVPRLTNPVNDGRRLMADTFKKAGFDVVVSQQDLGALETRRVLRDFADSAADADIAVIYYAGHGIEVDGTNYLIPVDAQARARPTWTTRRSRSIACCGRSSPPRRLRLVILDACRDNPFAKTMKRTVGATRSIGRGLAGRAGNPNTLIAYAAKAGSTARDGDGKEQPVHVSAVAASDHAGLDVRMAFGLRARRRARSRPAPAGAVRLRLARRRRRAAGSGACRCCTGRCRAEIRKQISAATTSSRCRSATHPRSMPSSRSIPTASTRASRSCSSRSSRPKRRMSPPLRKRKRPRSSARGLPPKARKRMRKPKPTPMQGLPRRRGLPPRRPSRSRRIRRLRPSASAPRWRRRLPRRPPLHPRRLHPRRRLRSLLR